MNDLLMTLGFAWLMKVNVASIMGDYTPHYWGCACPLKWLHPAYDISVILDKGEFTTNEEVVIAMADSVEDLQNKLLEKCQRKWID